MTAQEKTTHQKRTIELLDNSKFSKLLKDALLEGPLSAAEIKKIREEA